MRLALLLGLFPTIALAGNCAPHSAALAMLANNYGETVQATGLSATGTMLQIIANTDTGTWTVLETNASGMTCLRASGDNMEITPTAAAPIGEDG